MIAFILLKKDTDNVNVTTSYPLTGEYMGHIRNIMSGFSDVLTSLQPRPYARSGGFKEDVENLSKDVEKLGQDFTKSVKSAYGKTTTDASEER